MRILFDRCTPEKLKRFLSEHQVQTTKRLGWNTLENGDLIKAAEAAGYDVMVTGDKNIQYQQNLSERKIALVVLGQNRWPLLQKHLPEIVAAVNKSRANSYVFIEVPLPRKPDYRPSFDELKAEIEERKRRDRDGGIDR